MMGLVVIVWDIGFGKYGIWSWMIEVEIMGNGFFFFFGGEGGKWLDCSLYFFFFLLVGLFFFFFFKFWSEFFWSVLTLQSMLQQHMH